MRPLQRTLHGCAHIGIKPQAWSSRAEHRGGRRGSRVRIQAWALVRLRVTPVLRIFTGSIIRQWEIGQKNSAGGGDGPPREPLDLLPPATCLRSCFLSPALQHNAAQHMYVFPRGRGHRCIFCTGPENCRQQVSKKTAWGLTRGRTCFFELCCLGSPAAAQPAPRPWAPRHLLSGKGPLA